MILRVIPVDLFKKNIFEVFNDVIELLKKKTTIFKKKI
jgi:molybdopterin synthase catalytic subunit